MDNQEVGGGLRGLGEDGSLEEWSVVVLSFLGEGTQVFICMLPRAKLPLWAPKFSVDPQDCPLK